MRTSAYIPQRRARPREIERMALVSHLELTTPKKKKKKDERRRGGGDSVVTTYLRHQDDNFVPGTHQRINHFIVAVPPPATPVNREERCTVYLEQDIAKQKVGSPATAFITSRWNVQPHVSIKK